MREDIEKQKMLEEADAIEARLYAEESLKNIQATPEMLEDMLRRIREEDQKLFSKSP